MHRAILVVAALAACKGEKLKWNARAITKLTAGPFSMDIPPGWRDLSESTDPALAHLARRGEPSAHMIVREDAANTDSNIALMWTDVARPINCKAFFAAFDQMGASTSGIDRATLAAMPIGTDELCTFHMTDGDSVGTGHVRMHGSGYATLQCMHGRRTGSDNDTACEVLRAALARL